MSNTKKLCFSAMMLAVGILLPMLFHMIPNGGNIFAPMHLPVFCVGFLCGPYYGALIGLMCPLFSSLFTGMPVAAYLPNMMVELLVYGASSGLLFRLIKTKRFMLDVYLTLVGSMLLGRIAGGMVAYCLFLGGRTETYSWLAFFTAYFVLCWPAIVIQVLLIPTVVVLAKRSHFLRENDRYLSGAQRRNAKKQKEFFNSLAEGWRRNAALDTAQVASLLKDVPLREHIRILDVGCGTGVLDAYLLQQGCAVDAIDLSEKMIERARTDPAHRGVSYYVADFYTFESAAPYDALLVFDAFPHFTEKERFAQKAGELLGEEGMLYIFFDESREKINSHHTACAKGISVGLKEAEREAQPFAKGFETVALRDDEEGYMLALRKKSLKK